MQEEVTQRTVALCVEATKLSAGMLQQAMKKVLDEMQKGVTGHKTKLQSPPSARSWSRQSSRPKPSTASGRRSRPKTGVWNYDG